MSRMDLLTLLREPYFHLPLRWEGYESIVDCLNDNLGKYIAGLKNLHSSSDESLAIIVEKALESISRIDEFRLAIPDIVDHAFRGLPSEAFNRFSEQIEEFEDEFRFQASYLKMNWSLDFYFRVRRTLDPKLTTEEIFHVPFEKRHLTSTQRFSIPGLPCLYMADSLYICWEEMGRPPFHELHAAAFWEHNDKPNVLDLYFRPHLLAELIDKNSINIEEPSVQRWISNLLVLYPIIASCSIAVRYNESPYRCEYLLPQLLLQWIRKSAEFDGIRYASTRIKGSSWRGTSNYVFPAVHSFDRGFCSRLQELFGSTEPIGWQLLAATSCSPATPEESALRLKGSYFYEFHEGRPEWYADTQFGRIENMLRMRAELVKRRLLSKVNCIG